MIIEPNLEIMISTMNRSDLSFLGGIFPEMDLSSYSILIVNQTKLNQDLVSTTEGIRVINSREFGLSKSRNLAIENAIGDILVIADDDIEYLPDFDKTILRAYKKYDQASLISFQFLDENDQLQKKYPKSEGYTTSTKQPLSSVEMTFRVKDVREKGIRMNENFGLGTSFPSAEEQIFKDSLLRHSLRVAFHAKPILKHSGKISASNQGAPGFIRAITAQKFLTHRHWTYLWLFKYVFFLYRYDFISFFEQLRAFKIGFKAIHEIKTLEHEG
ncbi:glycosyltransferase, group 2 family [Psychroflexus torquis ATCC 700755]|uniref:Glycosyltransferase, group 2 family n=1 Tax=Psychroflexus torquis (strain ATCC 700755 / CIP 106069 / ACAM 623) TaxID=313595 RepID=K4INT8_PSYTT|nr:glycosyltransferase family 2 protein [Psychroflexus torquis]AFU67210.1 glycosyltransferase, group 2 family [Psychroflexus torquis ATCC 700755]